MGPTTTRSAAADGKMATATGYPLAMAMSVLDDADGGGGPILSGPVVAKPGAMQAWAHYLRKERERVELIEMILESIASVPLAVEKIHTNERLRAALEQEIGGEHAIFHPRRGSSENPEELSSPTLPPATTTPLWPETVTHLASPASVADSHHHHHHHHQRGSDPMLIHDDDEEDDSSSGYDSDYEKDLAEAVNQLVMSDIPLADNTALRQKFSSPIAIVHRDGDRQSAQTSTSPQSSVFGVSPGTGSQDGEPVAALWPRQPHQFAFTQEEEEEEEENSARVQDEVYSEIVCPMCEDGGDPGGCTGGQSPFLVDVFEMDDDTDHHQMSFDSKGLPQLEAPHLAIIKLEQPGDDNTTDVDSKEESDDLEVDSIVTDDDDSEVEDEDDPEYDVFDLRIIREKNRTGFEPSEDWKPRIGSTIGGKYQVQLEIGEAVFSRTYKGLNVETDQAVCLKVIKNSKEYFDQGIDEIRILQFLADRCNVDEKHLVELLDYFYFREHLIIVTELLRDNLYEFSKLLMERGNVNYFSMPRLKKVAIEVLEALSFLHSQGLIHCDLKPENILISNFNECRIKVIDFGSACFVTDELTSYVQSRSYRAPEVILGLSYDQKIDMWSLGCVLAELFTGDVLLKNDSEQSLLERIIGTIGPVPRILLEESAEVFVQFAENPAFALDAMGNGICRSSEAVPTLEAMLQTVDKEFVDFLRGLLQIHPRDRLCADDALCHPWLQHDVFTHSPT